MPSTAHGFEMASEHYGEAIPNEPNVSRHALALTWSERPEIFPEMLRQECSATKKRIKKRSQTSLTMNPARPSTQRPGLATYTNIGR